MCDLEIPNVICSISVATALFQYTCKAVSVSWIPSLISFVFIVILLVELFLSKYFVLAYNVELQALLPFIRNKVRKNPPVVVALVISPPNLTRTYVYF